MEPSKEEVINWEMLYNFYCTTLYPVKKNRTKPKTWYFRGDNPGCKCENDTDPLNCRCWDDIDPSKILKSKIDKDIDFFSTEKNFDYKRLFLEKYLHRDFCRKQFLYSNYQPKTIIEELALMRHHDGPTRLMDWTYSFFVAVYFAINKARNYCVVWAIDENWIEGERTRLHEQLNIPAKPPQEDNTWYNERVFEKFWDEYLWQKCNGCKWIYPITPYNLNKRLTIQRGIFLCQSDINISWYENFKDMAKTSELAKKSQTPLFYKIIIRWDKKEERDKIINMLFEMNITQATLFPDLDGFAMSLRTKLASPQCFPIPED